MNLKIKYTYEYQYVPPKCRKPRLGHQTEETDIDIRVITNPDEFPVAAIFRNENRDKPDEFVRGWYENGKCYTKDSNYAGRIASKQIPSGFIEWPNSGTLEEVLTSIKEWASTFLIFENEIWNKTDSIPGYVITTFGMGHNHGGTAAFAEFVNPQSLTTFRADEYELLREQAINTATRRGDSNDVERFQTEKRFSNGFIEIVRPEFLRMPSWEEKRESLLRIEITEVLSPILGDHIPLPLILYLAEQVRNRPDYPELSDYEQREKIQGEFIHFVRTASREL